MDPLEKSKSKSKWNRLLLLSPYLLYISRLLIQKKSTTTKINSRESRELKKKYYRKKSKVITRNLSDGIKETTRLKNKKIRKIRRRRKTQMSKTKWKKIKVEIYDKWGFWDWTYIVPLF